MEYSKFKEIMIGFGSVYNKTYNESELVLLYRYFRKYKHKDLVDAIDSCITSLDKYPSVNQLIEKCEMCRTKNELDEAYQKMPKVDYDPEWIDLLKEFS